MLLNPKKGTVALIWYGKATRQFMPCHGQAYATHHSGRGSPRNHSVSLADGRLVTVPCGNLRHLPAGGQPEAWISQLESINN